MRDLIKTYPIKSPAVRRAVVRYYDSCPECPGMLDTANVCMRCNFDATQLKIYQAPDDGPRRRRPPRRG
jgi:hypothetical protein